MRFFNLFTLLILLSFSVQAQNCKYNVSYDKYNNANPMQVVAIYNGTPQYDSIFQSYSYVLWGDGNSSSGDESRSYSFRHTYATAGTYYPKMISYIIDSNATEVCRDTLIDTVTIAPPPCYSTFTYQKAANFSTTYTFTANTPSGSSNKSYQWDFGDGNQANGASVTHTYSGTKACTVTLKTLDNVAFCIDSVKKIFTVLDTADFCTNKTMYFNTYQSQLNAGRYVHVAFSSFTGFYREIQWDFGDGNTYTFSGSPYYNTQSHIYAAAGNYNVQGIFKYKTSATAPPFCVDTFNTSFNVTNVSPPTIYIAGFVIKDSLIKPIAPKYKVWLIKYDVATNILSAIDSQIISGLGGMVYYDFSGYTFNPNDIYRVKATCLNNNVSTGIVPTYSYSELFWNLADSVCTEPINCNKEVIMRTGTVTSGPGFIGGNVLQGANKGTANGIANVDMFLLDNNDKLLQYVTTDNSGTYQFKDLPYGTYKVYTEELNYHTIPAIVTITSGNSTVNGIDFERSLKYKSYTPWPVGIPSIAAKAKDYFVYPNPASGKVYFEWLSDESLPEKISVLDMNGRVVFLKDISSKKLELNLEQLTSGLYFVEINTKEGKRIEKLVIQH